MAAWVKIYHPESGNTASVLESSLRLWVKKGWETETALVAPEPPAPEIDFESWSTSKGDPGDDETPY